MKISMTATLKATFTGVALGMIPVLQVTHAQQVVDPAAVAGKQSTITQTLNGTPVQNIATPNASGLSHNQFSTFNVGTQGLVINNSQINVISNIGGALVANPNLAGGEARLILNEVTSGNRSILQGTQELVGGRAAYILANPNGITCDGCGFINFPRATLTTGTPVISNGTVSELSVTAGDVLIGPGGLNATGVDYFDIITRSAVLAGQANANDLSLRLGSNRVNYATLLATAQAGAGTVPSFALDSSALGGMYVGRISLIATEAGLGVRMLGNVAASVSDVQLDVNGRISLRDNVLSAQRDVTLTSRQAAATPGNEIELQGVQVSAGNDVAVSGGDLAVTGGRLDANRNLAVQAAQASLNTTQIEAGQDLVLSATGAVTLSSARVQANRNLNASAGALTLSSVSTLMGEADLANTATDAGTTTVSVTGQIAVNDSALVGGSALDVTAGSLVVDANSNDNGAQGVRGGGTTSLQVATVNNAGLVASNGTLNLSSTSISNTGKLYGQGGLSVTASSLSNQNTIESGAGMTLSVASLSNQATATTPAQIYAPGALTITGNQTLSNIATAEQIARIVSRDGLLSIDSRTGAASTQSVSNLGGLLFGGSGVTVLVSREFRNAAQAGRRSYVFANNGNVLIGAPDSATLLGAAQAVTVDNIDSDIEARTGSLGINASFINNTTTEAAPLKGYRLAYRQTSGTFNLNGTSIPVYSSCGTFADNFGEQQLGTICAQYVDHWEEYLLSGPSLTPRSRMVAGGDLNLWVENQALNYISLISAVGNVSIAGASGATFENRAVDLLQEQKPLVYRYDWGARTGDPLGNCYTGTVYNKCFYNYLEFSNYQGPGPDIIGDILKSFTDISPPAVQTYTAAVPSTVQAGGTINVSLTRLVNGSGPGDRSGTAFVAPSSGNQTTSAGSGSTLPGVGSLSSSPFFIPTSSPTSPYLFETDPSLMSLAGLYGSDLFLQSLGLDPTTYLRVGDPYFEQQLLRQQLLAQAGQLFIADGIGSENEQFKMLMENAVAAGKDLKLRVGVALTAEQIANLKKDIVWMVEVEVNGRKALVPQLYLSDVTQAKIADGARFVASNIQVKTEGAVTNAGAFVASNNIDIRAGTTFVNAQGTLVAGNGLNIAAVGDIINQSGTIRGGDVSLTSTQGSIVNQTLTRDLAFGAAGTGTQVGATATIESSGGLKLDAARDIVSRGGSVTAGGDAVLKAGNDITFTAIEQKSFAVSQSTSQSDGYTTLNRNTQQSTTQVGSGLTVGGDLTATAGRDIRIEASTVDVAGNGSIDAGRNIVVTALGETSRTQQSTDTRSWNSTYTENTTIEQTTGKASTVNFGGNLSISSGGDTNIKGSDLTVDGNLDVKNIGGKLNVTTFEESVKVDSTTRSSSFFSGEAKAEAGKNITKSTATATATLYSNSEETTRIESTTNRGSGISVGGDLNAAPGAIKGDVNIIGSSVATGGDMNLSAGGNINVLAAEDKTTVSSSTKGTTFYLGGEATIDGASGKLGVDHTETNGSATQKTASVSALRSGGNMNINATGDFTEQGTQVAAGGDISVEARRINSLAAQDSYTETGDSLSVSASIGVKAETGLGAVVGSFVNQKTNKAGFDMAAASKSLNELSVPDAGSVSAELSVSTTKTTSSGSGNEARTSSFSSGGNTSFKAREGDVTFQGTSVDAGGSINVIADKGSVNILTANSSDRSSQSTTEISVTLGVSGDGTFSASGSGSTSSESSGSTSQTAASFKAGKDVTITAKKDVTLVGTSIEAGGTAAVEAREGKIDFLAARDTTTATSSEVSANVSVSANFAGKEGSVGAGGGTMDTNESSSTGKAGSIKAGNLVLKSKGDITLEGTSLAAKDKATIETQGSLEFKAVESTMSKTATGASAQVDIEAGATGGGASVSASRTDESEQSTTRTGGSLSASNLTIKAGTGARLVGTQVNVSENADIDTGTGKLVLESAVSTSTKRVNNTEVELAAKGDAKEGSGQGSFKLEGAYEDSRKVTNQNVQLNIGGKADIKAAGGIDIKGNNIEGIGSVLKAGSTELNGATITTEQREETNVSRRTDVSVSAGVIVPGRKARQEVADTVQKVRDSEVANTIRNKAGNATTACAEADA